MKKTNVIEFNPSMDALRAAVDEYGALCAQMAALKSQQAELKARLIASGEASVEGALFRVTVSKGVVETLDMEAVREKLSTQFITAHTIRTERTTVRCVSRNARCKAA